MEDFREDMREKYKGMPKSEVRMQKAVLSEAAWAACHLCPLDQTYCRESGENNKRQHGPSDYGKLMSFFYRDKDCANETGWCDGRKGDY